MARIILLIVLFCSPLYAKFPGTNVQQGKGDSGLALLCHLNEGLWNGTAGEVREEIDANHGVASANATTSATAKFGRAGIFDGTGDGVTMTNESDFDTLFDGHHAISFSFWCVDHDTATKYFTVITKGIDPIFTGVYGYKNILFFTSKKTGLINVSCATLTQNTLDWWVVTYDGSGAAAGVKFYKNLVLQTPTVANDNLGANVVANNTNITIGMGAVANWEWDGMLDEICVWFKDLSLNFGEMENIYYRQVQLIK